MTVAQLIAALQALPPDLPVVTHANNHTSNAGDAMVVGVALNNYSREVAVVGNWTWVGRHMPPRGDVFTVEDFGEQAGKLRRCRVVHEPAHERPVMTPQHVEASWKLVDDA